MYNHEYMSTDGSRDVEWATNGVLGCNRRCAPKVHLSQTKNSRLGKARRFSFAHPRPEPTEIEGEKDLEHSDWHLWCGRLSLSIVRAIDSEQQGRFSRKTPWPSPPILVCSCLPDDPFLSRCSDNATDPVKEQHFFLFFFISAWGQECRPMSPLSPIETHLDSVNPFFLSLLLLCKAMQHYCSVFIFGKQTIHSIAVLIELEEHSEQRS